MNKKFFEKPPNWIRLLISLILIIALGCGIWFMAGKFRVKPPVEFLAARQNSAEISQKIVELTSVTNGQIKEINSLDLHGDAAKALNLIQATRDKNKETLNQATKLANEIQNMAGLLNEISSSKNRDIAIQAITTEESLITNFINYNQILDQFLGNLNNAIAFSKDEYRQAAEKNLSDLNSKTDTINSLNQQFKQQMSDFDKSL